MHEFSLAQGLISQLLQLAEQHGAHKIITVRVDVGSLSGIVIDSFSFGFEVLARENILTADTVLAITEIEPVYRCRDCNATVPPELTHTTCPRCGSAKIFPTGGDDLVLTQVEME